ncbi:MAG: hypothetical protein V3S54_07570 [Woeseiaceae bacterium]
MKYPRRSLGRIISCPTFSHSLGQKQSFNNALAKVRFGMKSGSLRKAGQLVAADGTDAPPLIPLSKATASPPSPAIEP